MNEDIIDDVIDAHAAKNGWPWGTVREVRPLPYMWGVMSEYERMMRLAMFDRPPSRTLEVLTMEINPMVGGPWNG